MQVRILGQGLISLLLPADCGVCCRPLEPSNITFVCMDCWSKIEWLKDPYCSQCSRLLPHAFRSIPTSLCPECGGGNACFDRTFIPTLYEGVMKKVIHLLKYSKKMGIMRSLEVIIRNYLNFLSPFFPSIDLVVPIPLQRKKFRERVFNHADLMAQVVATHLQSRLIKDNLKRTKATITQTSLDRKERRGNLRGAFTVGNRREFEAKDVLLVDDVYTTGTTVKEAAKVLKEVGVRKVYVFALARAPQTLN